MLVLSRLRRHRRAVNASRTGDHWLALGNLLAGHTVRFWRVLEGAAAGHVMGRQRVAQATKALECSAPLSTLSAVRVGRVGARAWRAGSTRAARAKTIR